MSLVLPPPPDPTRVSDTIRNKLPFRVEFSKLALLAGDASNRRYFRLEVAGGPPHSLVLMQLASPEAFKQSEEAVSQGAPDRLHMRRGLVGRAGSLRPKMRQQVVQEAGIFSEGGKSGSGGGEAGGPMRQVGQGHVGVRAAGEGAEQRFHALQRLDGIGKVLGDRLQRRGGPLRIGKAV